VDARYWPHNTALYVTDFRGNCPRFVYYFLDGIDFSRYNSGGAQQSLNRNFIGPIEVSVPTYAEQECIARALGDVDGLAHLLQCLIVKKRAIKHGMMQELLTGRKRLPGFSGEWAASTIGALARTIGGGTPSTRVSSYWGGDIPWFTPAEIAANGSGLVSISERTITRDGLANSSASLLPAGTVLVTSRASVGNTAVAAVPVTTNQGFASLLPDDPRSTWFFYYWIQQNKAELESRSAGSTFLEISARKVAALPINAPPLDEQDAIGRVLYDADTEIEALGRRLEKARVIKQGMMQELLTGRTRLPVAAAP
jgi:type I restriction enzyme S subunit